MKLTTAIYKTYYANAAKIEFIDLRFAAIKTERTSE